MKPSTEIILTRTTTGAYRAQNKNNTRTFTDINDLIRHLEVNAPFIKPLKYK